MVFVALAIGYCVALIKAAPDGWSGLQIPKPEPRFWLFGLMGLILIIYLMGPVVGGAMIVLVYTQEVGQIAALRSFGHPAQIRTNPIFPLRTQRYLDEVPPMHMAFAALYGVATLLVIATLAHSISQVAFGYAPMVSSWASVIAVFALAYGAIMILPVWPFAGGRVAYALGQSFGHPLPYLAAALVLAVMIALAVGYQSLLLGVLAALTIRGIVLLQSLPKTPKIEKTPAMWLAGAYIFTAAAMFSYIYAVMIL